MMAGAEAPTEATAVAPASAKRWLIGGAKFIVTVTLCWLIVSWIDWQIFLAAVANAHYGMLFAVFLLGIFMRMLSAWKWQILLIGHGIHFPLIALIRWYFIGAFFNTFLPTNIGGDGYRLFKTYDNPKGKARAIGALLLERITGVLALGASLLFLRLTPPLAGGRADVLGYSETRPELVRLAKRLNHGNRKKRCSLRAISAETGNWQLATRSETMASVLSISGG